MAPPPGPHIPYLYNSMVLNYIWIAFLLIAFVIAVVKLVFWGDADVFPAIMNSTFSSAECL